MFDLHRNCKFVILFNMDIKDITFKRDELLKLSKEELIDDIIYPLLSYIQKLEQRIEKLENKINKPKLNSKNSSKPPSTDIKPSEKERKNKAASKSGKSVLAPNPDGVMDDDFFGPKLKSFILILYYDNYLSYNKIKNMLEIFGNVKVSKSAIINVIKRCGKIFRSNYEDIILNIKSGEIVGIDETGWRVCKKNSWLWTFQNEDYTAYKIDSSRGSNVVKSVIGDNFDGTVISDFYSVYGKKTGSTKKQKCLAHLIRKLNYIKELRNNEQSTFANRLLEGVFPINQS